MNNYIPLITISSLTILLSACGGGGGGGGDDTNVTTTAVGSPPVITATKTYLASKGDTVDLSATATDVDGDTLTYSWRQLSGTSVATIDNSTTANASLQLPSSVETLQFAVDVFDGSNTSTETVSVLVLEDAQDAMFIDGNTGSDTDGDGSFSAPYASISFALDVNPGSTADLYVKSIVDNGAYTPNRILAVNGGRSFYGGYNESWQRDALNNRTRIDGEYIAMVYFSIDRDSWLSGFDIAANTPVNSRNVGDELDLTVVAINGSDATFYMEDNTLTAFDAHTETTTNPSASVYGVKAFGLTAFEARRNTITVGNGGHAIQGDFTPTVGRRGGDGADGNRNSGNRARGGTSTHNGLEGGTGGSRGGGLGGDGTVGAKGEHFGSYDPLFGAGGEGGDGGFSPKRGGFGLGGKRGRAGFHGNSGLGRGNYSEQSGFQLGHGQSGFAGTPGYGGGGGGGGGAAASGVVGGGGGGGGQGGEGGQGGLGGYGGGASIAMELVTISFAIIENNTLTTANGGNGAEGHVGGKGGGGGAGGDGADGDSILLNNGADGGDGGFGGTGGTGGTGGGGAGGTSFGIIFGPGYSPTISGNTFTIGQGGQGAECTLEKPENSTIHPCDSINVGEGGWNIAIFDADTDDGMPPIVESNVFTISAPIERGIAGEERGET